MKTKQLQELEDLAADCLRIQFRQIMPDPRVGVLQPALYKILARYVTTLTDQTAPFHEQPKRSRVRRKALS